MTTVKRRQTSWTRAGAYGPRNKYAAPFSTHSIWNTPIGSGAVFGVSDLAPATFRQPLGYPEITSDPENIGMNTSDPLKTLSGGFPAPLANQPVHIPAGLTANGSYNNCTAFIGDDGKTIYQGQPLTLSDGGNGTMTYALTPVDIHSTGNSGSHGGSGLSGVGGSIRAGELEGPYPIRHVLKMNVYGLRFLSQSNNGYHWPATRADAAYNDTPGSMNYYGGSNPTMGMGTLLALPGSTDISWITSKRVQKLAVTLRDFGAYIVDNTGRDVHAFCAEKGAFPEVSTLDDKQFHLDLMDLITMLRVVTNNSPTAVGGGGAPRVSVPTPVLL